MKIIPGTRIVSFSSSGPVTLADREKNLERIVEYCREHGCTQVLVDTRQQINKMTTTEMFNFAASVPEATRGLQIALVRNADDSSIAFGDNVAANRGAAVRSFETTEEAQQWLEAEEPTSDEPLEE